jgi:hypothetical protein
MDELSRLTYDKKSRKQLFRNKECSLKMLELWLFLTELSFQCMHPKQSATVSVGSVLK